MGRLEFLREATGESILSEEMNKARDGFLDEVCYGETRFSEVFAKNLEEVFLRHLPSGVRAKLESEAPAEMTVPSGSRLKLHYPTARQPYIEVRLQEVFGWLSSPRLAGGRVPLQFHLLSPGYKPVQVTSDLESFWKNGYPEVRKELRLRYPKHSWPEDPFTAKAEAKGRPRKF